MSKDLEEMKKIDLEDLDHVVGGENENTPDMKIDFGDLEISVELKKEVTEDDLKGGDAKKLKGALANARISKKNK